MMDIVSENSFELPKPNGKKRSHEKILQVKSRLTEFDPDQTWKKARTRGHCPRKFMRIAEIL